MAHIIKLTKEGKLVYPTTIGEAVVVNGKLLPKEIERLDSKIDERLGDIESILDELLGSQVSAMLDELNG